MAEIQVSPKLHRGGVIIAILAILGLAAWLVLTALEDTVVFFYGPTEIYENPPGDARIRVGGLVVEGSVAITGIDNTFAVSDGANSITINFDGALPDLFREGQGIIAEGHLDGAVFRAETVLAKHDETYMPKEVADILKDQGVWQGEGEDKGEGQ